jgi:hypothetical protein
MKSTQASINDYDDPILKRDKREALALCIFIFISTIIAFLIASIVYFSKAASIRLDSRQFTQNTTCVVGTIDCVGDVCNAIVNYTVGENTHVSVTSSTSFSSDSIYSKYQPGQLVSCYYVVNHEELVSLFEWDGTTTYGERRIDYTKAGVYIGISGVTLLVGVIILSIIISFNIHEYRKRALYSEQS